jgi:hypothetical protein
MGLNRDRDARQAYGILRPQKKTVSRNDENQALAPTDEGVPSSVRVDHSMSKTMTRRETMSVMCASSSVLLLVALGTGWAATPPPSLDAPELGQGPGAAMHMTLQKTFLRINVATLDVRFDKATQARFVELSRGKTLSPALEQQLATVAIGAGRAVVQMKFMRDIPLNRWIGVVRENLEQARAAGLITAAIEKQVGDGLPQWFSALKDRGYKKADRLLYAVAPDGLRTVVVSDGGQVLIDRTDREQGVRNVVLASYFAPGSDFRQPLLRSLLEARP